MKWIEILKKGNTVLLQNELDTQYVVASGYNPDAKEDEQYSGGKCFSYHSNNKMKAEKLSAALEYFRYKTEEKYISRCRLEELATLFKDALIENDEDYASEYFDEECEMSDDEKCRFGI